MLQFSFQLGYSHHMTTGASAAMLSDNAEIEALVKVMYSVS